MSFYFLESSALGKRYTIEIGTPWLNALVAPSSGHRIGIAQITPLELVSSLARKQRETRISSRTLQAALLLIERHVNREYIVVQLNKQVEQEAKRLLVTYPMRAMDSIQLASALVINHQLIQAGMPPLTFICSDKQLLSAATQEQLAIDNPNLYP